MKIVFLDVFYPLPINSGGDWYRYFLLDELSAKNDVIAYFNYQESNKKGLTPDRIGFSSSILPKFSNWKNVSKLFDILRPEFFLIRPKINDSFDAIFASTYCYHIAKKVAGKNTPIVLVMHNIEWKYLKENKSLLFIPMFFYELLLIKKSKYIITISEKDHEYIKKFNKKGLSIYLPPIVNFELFNPNGNRFNYGDDRLNLLFYGSLNRDQNIEGLKFIVNELIPYLIRIELTNKIRINIFGSGRPPTNLGIENHPHINYIGEVEDPGYYIRGADIVIIPIKNSAGMKIRVLESLACAKMIIAFPESIYGLPKEIQKFIFTANSAKEFCNIIQNDFINFKFNFDIHNLTVLLGGANIEIITSSIKLENQ